MQSYKCPGCGRVTYVEGLCSVCGALARTTESARCRVCSAALAGSEDVCGVCGTSTRTVAPGPAEAGRPSPVVADPAPALAAPPVRRTARAAARSAARYEAVEVVVYLAAAATILGSLLPWAGSGFVSFSNVQGDARFTLIAGVLGLLPLGAGERRWRNRTAVFGIELVLAALAAAVAGYHVVQPLAASGVYVCLLAAAVWAVAALIGLATIARRPG